MKLILCLDDRNGMLFNKRRQSRDVEVCRKIESLADGNAVWMSPYSVKLFEGTALEVLSDEDFLHNRQPGDLCFVEDRDISAVAEEIEMLYVFRWNRAYPADLWCPESLLKIAMKLVDSCEFSGNSHPTITLEVYTR